MSRIAVVQIDSNIVSNLIIAEVTDPPYEGTFLVNVNDIACNIGWLYDPVTGDFTDPNPPPLDEGGV